MKKIISIIFILSINFVYGQNEYLKPIDSLSIIDSDVGRGTRPKFIYFHHEGCWPCKSMDKLVLSDSVVKKYLSETFDCYSVYGFKGTNKLVRNMYNVTGSPTFLILDSLGQPIHELAGMFNKESFLLNVSMYDTYNLQMFRNLFRNAPEDLNTHRNFIHAIDRAGRLQDKQIVDYLNSIPIDLISIESKWFSDVIYYGSMRSKLLIDAEGPIYKKLRQIQRYETSNANYKALAMFLYFIDHDRLYNTDLSDKNFDALISRLRDYETGDQIYLKSIRDTTRIVSVCESRIPSFTIYHNKLTSRNLMDQADDLLQKYRDEYKSHADVLNELAWNIYINHIRATSEVGISIIEDALSNKKSYNILDTYAHLLFKSKRYDEARDIATKAIKMAREQKINCKETSDLLELIPF